MRTLELVTATAGVLCALSTSAQSPDYVITLDDEVAEPGTTVSMSATLDVIGPGIQGWSYGVCIDPAILAVVSFALGDTATVSCGTLPGFMNNSVVPGGWTQGVVIRFFSSCNTLPSGTLDFEMLIAELAVDPLAGPATTPVAFCNTLGNPPVATVVVSQGVSIVPTQNSGSVTISSLVPLFRRGDCNGDSIFDIADPVSVLNVLFPVGPPPVPPCADACDANDDATLNIADPIAILLQLFPPLGPPPPLPAPGPFACGPDPTADALDCVSSVCP